MHYLALLAVAMAGGCFCLAAWLRLRRLRDNRALQKMWTWPVWSGLALLTIGFVASWIDGEHERFRFGVTSSLAAIASIFFASRFLSIPSRGLLVLPVGGMALLVAMSGLTEARRVAEAPSEAGDASMPLSLLVHILVMSLHLAAMLVAGAFGGLYLITGRKLKTSVNVALQLPSLSTLERWCEQSLVVATGLLIGGLITGAFAIQQSPDFSLFSKPVLSAVLSMTILVALLSARLAGRLNRRYLAFGALVGLGLAALSILSVSAGHHVA